jgi:hypothetical protein
VVCHFASAALLDRVASELRLSSSLAALGIPVVEQSKVLQASYNCSIDLKDRSDGQTK